MSKPMHVMIDIETLGKSPKSVVTQIACVPFDRDEVYHTKAFNCYVQAKPQVNVGREIDPDTVFWWMQQSEDARNELVEGVKRYSKPPRSTLVSLASWPAVSLGSRWKDFSGVWAKSPQFDITILNSLCEDFGFVPPWEENFRDIRDVRSYSDFLPVDYKPSDFSGYEHDALYDCRVQIDAVQSVMRAKS